MAKCKKKKLADHVSKKKEDVSSKKKLNPFEVHINKDKHKILGKKSKSDRGLPGVARAKAIKKRKHTLLEEYKVLNKSNKFIDRRIGEKNMMMSEEDRKMARFTAQRIKSHSKKSIFNLADDEVLTHKGQTLSEIEKFDDPRSDESDDEDGRKTGRLEDDFVDNAHFGGGILKKTGIEGAKSHKDLIDQLIAESKKRKAQKQKIREQTLDLTEKLDSEWKDLLPLVNKIKKNAENSEEPKNTDDYDKVMRELRFEARGQPSDRLKTEDELAKEEKEKLEKLEKERLDRMRGYMKSDKPIITHRSADDLDDNFIYDADPEEVTLAYDAEGKSNISMLTRDDDKKNESKNDEETEDSEEESEMETESEDDLSDLKAEESNSDEEANDENSKTVNDNSNDETYVKSSEGDISEEKIIKSKKNKSSKQQVSTENKSEKMFMAETFEIGIQIEDASSILNEMDTEMSQTRMNKNSSHTNEKSENIKLDLMIRKNIMEKAREELPYTFALPDSYETLQTLLVNHSPEYQSIIIERMIKCNHPSLAEGNKDNLGKLLIYLLQHINDVSVEGFGDTDIKLSFKIFNCLVPHVYDLAQLNAVNTINSMVEILKEKQEEYKKNPKKYPGVETLLFLKLISLLFPTSDFRHQVVTPAFVFIGQMLTNCKVKTQRDITYGLFLVTLLLEYIFLSKRFVSPALSYLTGILHMAIPKPGVKLLKVNPPFKSNATLLVLTEANTSKCESTMNLDDFSGDLNEDFKVRSLHTAVKLSEEFFEYWKTLPSCIEIFSLYHKFLDKISVENYPDIVKEKIKTFRTVLSDAVVNQNIKYIVLEQKRPKALRLYEPNIQKVFDGKKHKVQSKEKTQMDKLLHKYKQERKGALREIRKDRAFLGNVKIKQQIQSDLERKEKVKRIYAEASIQQAEFHAMERKKKH